MRSGDREGSSVSSEDRRLLEYLMMNWRMSLLNAYLNGGLDKQDEMERAINRCSIIMGILREGTGEVPGPALLEQLSLLASELSDIVGDEEAERRPANANVY